MYNTIINAHSVLSMTYKGYDIKLVSKGFEEGKVQDELRQEDKLDGRNWFPNVSLRVFYGTKEVTDDIISSVDSIGTSQQIEDGTVLHDVFHAIDRMLGE